MSCGWSEWCLQLTIWSWSQAEVAEICCQCFAFYWKRCGPMSGFMEPVSICNIFVHICSQVFYRSKDEVKSCVIYIGKQFFILSLLTNYRIVLLHGPPGTGKTSLCKALAQKLSIRFKSRSVLNEIYGLFVLNMCCWFLTLFMLGILCVNWLKWMLIHCSASGFLKVENWYALLC